jgi:ectoine hydroxylase-related dioxygenase (phytanoyl-CoA dioxygenase family)
VKLYWDQAVYKKPETPRDFPWHQDNGYTPVLPEEYLTCWLALEDANIHNGCIWVLPETHKQGLVEHKETSIGKQCYFGSDPGVAVELRKGGMAFFSSLMFHRSGPNVSDSIRKGYIVQYAHASVRDKASGEPRGRFVVAQDGKLVTNGA